MCRPTCVSRTYETSTKTKLVYFLSVSSREDNKMVKLDVRLPYINR